MTYVKPKNKFAMTPKTLNALAFIKMNGPKTNQVNINSFVKEYLARPKNRVCNPPTGSQTRTKSVEDSSPTKNNDASYVSTLFGN